MEDDKKRRPPNERDEELFDLGFQEDSEESEDLHSYARNEILPDTPTIGGMGMESTIHGRAARSLSGRSSSPLIFAQASSFNECTQLRCWVIENGIPTGLGLIDANATEEDFIQQFPSAMPQLGSVKKTFKCRPLNIDGSELGQEITFVISEHHAALQKMSQTDKMLPSGTPNGGIHQSMIDMLNRTLSASQDALSEERKRTQHLMSQMAQERIDLATNAASGVENISQRMMEADAKRHEAMLRQETERNRQSQDSMAAFFQSNLEVMQSERERSTQQSEIQMQKDKTFYERMMEQESIRREQEKADMRQRVEMIKLESQMRMEEEKLRRQREREESKEKLEQQRQEWELRREKERDDFERRERDRRRDADEKRLRDQRDAKDREGERQRQHELKLREMEMASKRDKEHQERMMQLQVMQFDKQKSDGIGGLKGLLKEAKSTLEDFGIDPKDVVDRFINGDGGTTSSEVIGALTKIAGNAADVMKAGISANKPAQVPPYNPYMGMNPNLPMPPQYQPQMQAPPQIPPQPTQPAQEAPEEPSKPKITIDLKVQRSARKALRQLVGDLQSSPSDLWDELITTSITNEFSIYHYCNAASVSYALEEAGAPKELAVEVIKRLKASPLVPDDLQYFGE